MHAIISGVRCAFLSLVCILSPSSVVVSQLSPGFKASLFAPLQFREDDGRFPCCLGCIFVARCPYLFCFACWRACYLVLLIDAWMLNTCWLFRLSRL